MSNNDSLGISEDRVREIVEEQLRLYRIQYALSWLPPERVVQLFEKADPELREIYRPFAESAQKEINARPPKPKGFLNRLFKG